MGLCHRYYTNGTNTSINSRRQEKVLTGKSPNEHTIKLGVTQITNRTLPLLSFGCHSQKDVCQQQIEEGDYKYKLVRKQTTATYATRFRCPHRKFYGYASELVPGNFEGKMVQQQGT